MSVHNILLTVVLYHRGMIIQNVSTYSPTLQRAVPSPPGEGGAKAPAAGGKNNLQMVGNALLESGAFLFNETVLLSMNDPAFVLTQTAPEALNAFNKLSTSQSITALEGAQNVSDQWWPTGTRLALLGVNGVRLAASLRDPESHWIRKGADGLRVATDLVGVAGAIVQATMPQYAGLGGTLLGIATTADACSTGIRLMDHANQRRVQFTEWNEERKAKQKGTSEAFS